MKEKKLKLYPFCGDGAEVGLTETYGIFYAGCTKCKIVFLNSNINECANRWDKQVEIEE